MVNNYITYISGGLSGIVEIFFTHPIEYHKTLSQINSQNKSLSKFIIETNKKEGFKGLYKGMLPRFIGIIPMRTVFWGTLITTENLLNNTQIEKKYVSTISGMSAGFIQTIIDCPIESMKTKIMMNQNIQKINFHGFIPNLARNVFFAMIFNIQKKKIESYQKNRFFDVFIGAYCGITASIITQPFDYLKTQKQLYGEKKNFKTIINENRIIKNYWKGGGSRALITSLSMAVGLPVFNFINYNLFNNK